MRTYAFFLNDIKYKQGLKNEYSGCFHQFIDFMFSLFKFLDVWPLRLSWTYIKSFLQ